MASLHRQLAAIQFLQDSEFYCCKRERGKREGEREREKEREGERKKERERDIARWTGELPIEPH